MLVCSVAENGTDGCAVGLWNRWRGRSAAGRLPVMRHNTTPLSGSRGNDELRTPCAIRSARRYWEYDYQSPSTHRRRARPYGPPTLIPGTVRVAAGRRKHRIKCLMMREGSSGSVTTTRSLSTLSAHSLPSPRSDSRSFVALKA